MRRGDRRRRFDGRYTYVYSQIWREPDVKTLSRDARHLLFCLMTGSLSTQAGIVPLSPEAIMADFAAADKALTRDELETLLRELETRPTPARSFVLRDADLLYFRDQFRTDPGKRSDNTRKGVLWCLSRLPKRSKVVKRFRKDHAEFLVPWARQGARVVPESREPRAENRDPRAESREPRPARQPGRRSPEGFAPIDSVNGDGSNQTNPEWQDIYAHYANVSPHKSGAELTRMADEEFAKRRKRA